MTLFKNPLIEDLFIQECGWKAVNLANCLDIANIPPFFVGTNELFKQFLMYNQLDKKIYGYLDDLNNNKLKKEEVSEIIQSLILKSTWDSKIVLELENVISDFDFNIFAIRSSSILEDNKDMSFAGIFDTELNVSKENMLFSIKKSICFII